MSTRPLIFVTTLFTREAGGIPAVNRSILPALVELAEERELDLMLLDLMETQEERPADLPDWVQFVGCDGNRRTFSKTLIGWSPRRPTWFFERVGLAVPLLPATIAGWARSVIFAHGRENWIEMRRRDRASLVRSTLVITNSDYTLRKMRDALGRRFRGESCPLGLSPSFPLRQELSREPTEDIELIDCNGKARSIGGRMLLLVGRLDPREREKGHYPLLAAMPLLLRTHPDVQLVFAGYGKDLENLVRRARELGVGDSVFIPGRVSDEELDRLYRHSYAFVMPSQQEGFGLVYLEAMNHGKACIGCAGDGAEDVIVDGVTGRLIRDPWDASEMRNVLASLLDDPQGTSRMGANGFARLQERFTPQAFRARLKTLLGSVLDSRNGSG